jgi:hypothetical protein
MTTYLFFNALWELGGSGPWVFDNLIRPLEWSIYWRLGMDW